MPSERLLIAVHVVLTATVIDGRCYHDAFLPNGKVPPPSWRRSSQNNVFKKGRPLHCIHQTVIDTKTVEGLGAWERGETGR